MPDLQSLQIVNAPRRPLLPRCLELGSNLTPDDAAYAALAEALHASLLTADPRLAQAPDL